jgi:glucose/arabinose dehydrogenase
MWRIRIIPTLASLTLACTLVTSAFAQEDQASPNPAPVQPSAASIPLRVTTFASNLEHPWGLTFLPDGRMLVSERPGRLRLITQGGQVSSPIQGVPAVVVRALDGLFDVELDPNFASNRLVYLCYAEPGEGDTYGTAVARGILNQTDTALAAVQVIFRQEPKVTGNGHLGCRLQFAPDGTLFVTLGERFNFPDEAQDLSNTLGKIVRINPDGSVPPDNPFVGLTDAQPEIWSYGHRNVQGAAIHPETGELWTTEHGPRGGDEVNIVLAGRNYGWPLVSWGVHGQQAGPYQAGEDIPDPPTRPDLEQSIYHWTSAFIAPSGATFYTGDRFPTWRGNFFIAGLRSQLLVRLTLSGQQVTGEERIALGDRIREVQQGPDGFLYLLTDNPAGRVLRLEPAPTQALTCRGFTTTRVGTPNNDTIDGTSARDVIHGLGGSDTISGFGGNDALCGGDGDDTLRGGGGSDQLSGARGRDTCIGGDGRDTAEGCEVTRTL